MVDVGGWLAENPHPIRGALVPAVDERVGEPIREAWDDRPWWLRKRPVRKIVRPLTPSVPKAISNLRERLETERLIRHLRDLVGDVDDLDVRIRITWVGRVNVSVPVDATVDEIRPVYDRLVADGWEQKGDPRDSSWGRTFEMKHDEWNDTLRLKARVEYGSECEIVEHEVEKTETEYEVVCAGEREIREAARGS